MIQFKRLLNFAKGEDIQFVTHWHDFGHFIRMAQQIIWHRMAQEWKTSVIFSNSCSSTFNQTSPSLAKNSSICTFTQEKSYVALFK